MDDLTFKTSPLVLALRQLEAPAWTGDAPDRSGDQMALYKRKGTNNWMVDLQAPDGRRVRQSTSTSDYDQARRFEAQLLLRLDAGQIFDIPRPSQTLTVQELVDRFLAYQLKVHPRSYTSYYLPATKAFTDWTDPARPIASLTLEEVQQFHAERASQQSVSTANRNLAVLKSMFNLAMDWGLMETSPATRARKQREPEGRRTFLNQDQQRALLANTQGPFRNIVIVALRTGMRRGELLRLRPCDVDFGRGLITVAGTKTDSIRTVPLLPEVRSILEKLAGEISPEDHFFRSRLGQVYYPSSVTHIFQRACKRAGLKDVHFHDLRHTFASDLMAAKVDMLVIMGLMGHKNISTTQLYTHYHNDRVMEAMQDLNAYLAAQSGLSRAQSGDENK